MTARWYVQDASGDLVFSLHVQPGAKRTEIAGLHGEALKIRLAAPPVDGKANACLIAFLAKQLEVPRSQVELVSGDTSRQKRLRVSGASAERNSGSGMQRMVAFVSSFTRASTAGSPFQPAYTKAPGPSMISLNRSYEMRSRIVLASTRARAAASMSF